MAWALMIVTDSFDQPGGMWFNPGTTTASTSGRAVAPVVVDGPGSAVGPEILPLR
jgi:hypothetical protein